MESSNQSPKIIEKKKQSFLNNYNVDNPAKSPIIKEKIKQTCLERYGRPISMDTKQSMLNKYGVDNCTKIPEIYNKICKTKLERYGNAYFTNPNKMKQTNLQKYGFTTYTQTEEFKQQYSLTAGKHISSKSKEEQILYDFLIKYFSNYSIIRSYRTKEYPYNCDFYIKELDLRIEYQGFCTHHGKLFDKNNKYDIIELEKLKSRISIYKPRYQTIINVWTNYDIKKWNIIKSNKLNCVLLYPKFIKRWKLYCKKIIKNNIYDDNIINELIIYFTNLFNKFKNIKNYQLIEGEISYESK